MRNGSDDDVVASLQRAGIGPQAVFPLGRGRIDERVVNGDLVAEPGKPANDVDHLGVAHVGHVGLEGEAEDQDAPGPALPA